jgi:long-chain fatty acid transport protein
MKQTTKKTLLAGLIITSALPMNAAATRTSFVDAFAAARGNAFTATADNASAVFYNGAGLTQLEGTQVHGSLYTISLGFEFDGIAGREVMNDAFQSIPSFFAAHKFKDLPVAIGFGVYAPFAIASDWGSDATFTAPFPSPISAVPYQAELEYVKYHGTLAWQLCDTLSLAAGISFDDTKVALKTNAVEFDGTDQTVGFSASVLWKPSEQHAFGLNYQARTEATYHGTASGPLILEQTAGIRDSIGSGADLVFPESITFGYAYRPNQKWNVEFNLDWTNWDHVNSLALEGVIGADYQLQWQSAINWEFGATRTFNKGWHVSVGYTFVENAIPDAQFLPVVPDSDRHFFTLGVGRTYEHFSWQFAYQFAYADERSVSKNTTSPTINGDYDLDSQSLACSLSYIF